MPRRTGINLDLRCVYLFILIKAMAGRQTATQPQDDKNSNIRLIEQQWLVKMKHKNIPLSTEGGSI